MIKPTGYVILDMQLYKPGILFAYNKISINITGIFLIYLDIDIILSNTIIRRFRKYLNVFCTTSHYSI